MAEKLRYATVDVEKFAIDGTGDGQPHRRRRETLVEACGFSEKHHYSTRRKGDVHRRCLKHFPSR